MKIAVFARCIMHKCNLDLENDVQITHEGIVTVQNMTYHQFDITAWVCPTSAAMADDQDKYYVNAAGMFVESSNGSPKWICEDTWLMIP